MTAVSPHQEKGQGTVPPERPERGGGRADTVALLCLAASVLIVLTVLFADLSRMTVGILVIALVMLLLVLRIPVGVAMVGAGAVGLLSLGGDRVLESSVMEMVFGAVANWQLSVVPLFILMGIALWRGGITSLAYVAARQWLGQLPGGLAVATNVSGAGLAAGSGSTVGISYALGRIAIPEMMRANYDPRLATGVVAMAGTLGQLIPPSVMLVLYAGIAQVPVGPQIMAAVIPGLAIAALFAVVIVLLSVLRPDYGPRVRLDDVNWSSRFASLLGLVPILLVVGVVLGGIFFGVFTPTEAGAYGAFAALVVGGVSVVRGSEDSAPRALASFVSRTARDTAASTAAIFLLIIGVEFLTRVVSLSGLAQSLAGLLVDWDLSRVELLLLLIVVYLVLGMFLDPLAMMLLTVPVLHAPLQAVGVDMLWFGVFIVILAEIAIVTPPIGILNFIVHRLAQDPQVNLGREITLGHVFRGVIPFVVAIVIFLVLMIFLPDLALWLPGISSSS